MHIERHQTGPRMSRIVIHQGTAYICGQVAKDDTDNITGQTKTMLEKVDDLLTSIGSDKSNLLSATIYLAKMTDFDAMNSVWDSWIPEGQAPARACVEAKIASPELLVEISIIAAVKS
ncbi:MAG: RidA family protein [Marinomonadaceae bacterium]